MAAASLLTAFSLAPACAAARSTFTLGAPWSPLAVLQPRTATFNSTVSVFPCSSRRNLSGSGVRAVMGSGRQEREKPGPGQESVWDYPRPPALEPVPERIRIEFNSKTIADTNRAYRVLETSHPPG
jgi:hypothetical protein